MPSDATISTWHWVAFVLTILFFLALDLGVFHRESRTVSFKEAVAWTAVWASMAISFAWFWVRPNLGRDPALLFVTGYLTELSLSMDNVFVIALIFGYFKVPLAYQHRVLFWGVLGALVMRGGMIWAGGELIQHFHWSLYFFGAFLIFTGAKMLFAEEEGVHPEENPVVRLVRKVYPVASDFDGARFVTRVGGRRVLTPLALVLVMVETTDLVFAVDSIPAIFGFTTNPFLVFTSNVFAILGLRSLYFVLAGALNFFRFLKAGLSMVLIFIGLKMLVDPHSTAGNESAPKWFQFEISSKVSLAVVGFILGAAVVASLVARRMRDDERKPGSGGN